MVEVIIIGVQLVYLVFLSALGLTVLCLCSTVILLLALLPAQDVSLFIMLSPASVTLKLSPTSSLSSVLVFLQYYTVRIYFSNIGLL